jgi:hypothetical protein
LNAIKQPTAAALSGKSAKRIFKLSSFIRPIDSPETTNVSKLCVVSVKASDQPKLSWTVHAAKGVGCAMRCSGEATAQFVPVSELELNGANEQAL